MKIKVWMLAIWPILIFGLVGCEALLPIAANSQSLSLYGRVVDQNGDPVVGAKVRGNVLLVGGMTSSGSQDNYTETDAQGRFKFVGLHGVSFGVVPSKDGYEYSERQTTNWSKDYKPDPDNPMLFAMWKLQGAESMVHQDFHFLIPCDGTPTSVNLQTGKIVASGGDVVITFLRNPVQIIRGKPFEWSLTLEVPDGGLTEIHEAYPYEAPENGYQSAITIGTRPNPKDYSSSAKSSYYFKSANGKYYGRIRINFQADFQPPPTFLQIEAYINPSGSRNLEFDPAKQIKLR